MITNIRTNWNTRRVGHITVSVQPKTRTPYTILRVESMIDTGFGRPTAILKMRCPMRGKSIWIIFRPPPDAAFKPRLCLTRSRI